MNLEDLLITDYDYSGGISDSEAEELIKEAEKFLEITLSCIKEDFQNYGLKF